MRLDGLADAWLTHDRPIHVPCDDSVTRAVAGLEAPVRRSRGYAPLPISLPFDAPPSLAVGGDVKNTFCLAEGRLAWMSGHIGDMDDLATQRAFGAAVEHLSMLTGVEPRAVAADRHPAYRSRRWAVDHFAGGRRRRGPAPPRPRRLDDGRARRARRTAGDRRRLRRHRLRRRRRVVGRGVPGRRLPGLRACRAPRLRRPARRRRRRAQPVPDGALPPAQRGRAVGSLAAQRPRLRRHRAQPARPPARDRPAVRADVQHGTALRRGRVAGRHLPPRRVRRPGRDGARGARAAVRVRRARAAHPGYCFGEDGDPTPVIWSVVQDVRKRTDPGLVAARFQAAVVDLVVDTVRRLHERDRSSDGHAERRGLPQRLPHRGLRRAARRPTASTCSRHHQVPASDAGIALGQLAVLAHRGVTSTDEGGRTRRNRRSHVPSSARDRSWRSRSGTARGSPRSTSAA